MMLVMSVGSEVRREGRKTWT